MTANVVISDWASPYTSSPLTDLDIQVPPGGWLDARYVFRVSTANAAWVPAGLSIRGYTTGDYMTGVLELMNAAVPSGTTGANWSRLLFNETLFDNKPGSPRQVDLTISPSGTAADGRIFLQVRYKNNTASTVTLGWDFGADLNVPLNNVNMTFYKGSSVFYSLLP